VHAGDARAIRVRSAVVAARALSAAGWTVGVGSPRRDFVASSRSARYWHQVPTSWAQDGDVDAFVAATQAAVSEVGYDIVFATNDSDALALAAHRHRLGTVVPFPPYDRMRLALDKAHLASAASRAGLRSPRLLNSRLPDHEVVVKPRIHESGQPEAMICRDPAQAAERVKELEQAGIEPLVQERLRGDLMALVVVADRESRVVARVQQEARAIFPLEAGVSVRAETVAVDQALAAKVSELIRELGWSGLAQIQFLVPPGQGEPVLIDFNGRFYGSLALGIAAGVNLPDIWAGIALGRPVAHAHDARPGVRYQWLEGDLQRARARATGPFARGVIDSLRYFRGAAHNSWSPTDPAPAVKVVQSLVAGSRRFRLLAARRRLRPARPSR
jgi:predicted ATP-grasp superfamily ATP-dependent carboligase